jgi:hypothetical protein
VVAIWALSVIATPWPVVSPVAVGGGLVGSHVVIRAVYRNFHEPPAHHAAAQSSQ